MHNLLGPRLISVPERCLSILEIFPGHAQVLAVLSKCEPFLVAGFEELQMMRLWAS